MPSREHAVLVELFRARPSLVPTLLRHLGVRAASATRATVRESTLPVDVPDFHADLAVALRARGGQPPSLALLEVQLSVAADKPARWLLYQAAGAVRHKCDVVVLVVAPSPRVARWAARPRAVGPRGSYAPLVLGPAEIPILSTRQAKRFPELAVLSLLAHRREADRAALRAVGEGIARLEPDQARLYFDLLHSKLGDVLLRAVEGIMIDGEPLSKLSKKYYRAGIEKGRRQGLVEGKAEGLVEGKAEGLVEGKAEGLVGALLRVLAARALTPTAAQRKVIVACKDVSRVERWIAAALRAATVKDVLGAR